MTMAKKRNPLGKGLGALLGDNIESIQQKKTTASNDNSTPFQELPISNITPSSTQPRKVFNKSNLQELANSISKQGVIQPVIVRKNKKGFELVAGERRWRAAQMAGLTNIPAIIRDIDDSNSQIIGLLENIQRQNLNAVEISESIHILVTKYSISHNDIAEALGMSRPAVSNLLRLVDLPPTVKTMVIEAQIDMGHARTILAVEEQHRLAFANHISAKNLTVRQTEALAKRWPLSKPNLPTLDRDIEHFIRQCSDSFGMQVDIKHRANGGGKFIINYQSLDQLHGLTNKIMAPKSATELTKKSIKK